MHKLGTALGMSYARLQMRASVRPRRKLGNASRQTHRSHPPDSSSTSTHNRNIDSVKRHVVGLQQRRGGGGKASHLLESEVTAHLPLQQAAATDRDKGQEESTRAESACVNDEQYGVAQRTN
jgi:hypothetical protein